MALNSAFIPQTPCYGVATGVTASTAFQVLSDATAAAAFDTYSVTNASASAMIFVLTASSTAAALPASGASTPKDFTYSLGPNLTRNFRGPGAAWFSAILVAGAGNAYITGGEGATG